MTKGNKIILTIAILMIVMIWYFTEQGIIGKKQEALGYSFGSILFGGDQTYISGCTDPQAENYNEDASTDNGLCYFHGGCCDVNAQNYDSEADSCNVPNNNLLTCNYS